MHRARGCGGRKDDANMPDVDELDRHAKRAHPDLNQGPADLQSAALTTELCTHLDIQHVSFYDETGRVVGLRGSYTANLAPNFMIGGRGS